MSFPKIASLKTSEAFLGHVARLGIDLPFEERLEVGEHSPLGRSFAFGARTIGNRFAILPMEGWDGASDGRPSPLTERRWRHFGRSGAKLIWGGEAVAVRPDGRANPNQLMLNEDTLTSIANLREILVNEHESQYGSTSDLYVGLQLTHSGRFSRPYEKTKSEPRIAYRHPWLDDRVNAADQSILSDEELLRLIDDFIQVAKLAAKAGFAFVDIKHCHGYLGHELLSARERTGPFGGSLTNRANFLRRITEGIRAEAPCLEIGVRMSAFDTVPFAKDVSQRGAPAEVKARYDYAFGGDGSGVGMDLSEPIEFLKIVRELGIRLLCVSAGSPYYNPHILRPAAFPPSDGYLSPEDPLIGVARHVHLTAELKRAFPDMVFVGSGYSYLQEWLPHVSQSVLRRGLTDFVGLGRMALSYPEFPADVLAGKTLARTKICRTFSDCTTAPRNGLVSGCYPLDDFYGDSPDGAMMKQIKAKKPMR